MVNEIPWWKKTTVYQIYPRSFMDSTGNGIGDLAGIMSQLDYLQDLGIETIWFSPFYSSPQKDFGYDISDYLNIAPEYGDMNQCNELIQEIHNRKMKIVLDMVMNHTSDQHPWFLESRSSRDNPKRDWYIWKDGKKPHGKAPPTNWQSRIIGNGWHYDDHTDQWYWAQFLSFQPDLNYRNPEVKKTMFDIVRFWLAKGIDGFRLDIIDAVYEDQEFRNNPFIWQMLPSDRGVLFRSNKMTNNHPDTLEFVKELRRVIEEFQDPPRFLVGEVDGPLDTLRKYCGSPTNEGLNLIFLFKSLGVKLEAKALSDLIKKFEDRFQDPFLPTWVFSNHDIIRRISRLGNNHQKAKLNIAFQLTVRGVPFIYYGEEIGMKQNSIPFVLSLDAVNFRFKKSPKFVQKFLMKISHEAIHRDNCRTPMQWNSALNAGFSHTKANLWLPLNDNYKEINVEQLQKEKNSLWNCYKRFIEVRKSHIALHAGSLQINSEELISKNILHFSRKFQTGEKSETLEIYLNFNEFKVQISNKTNNFDLICSTDINSNPIQDSFINLDPFEAIILK